MIVSTTVSVRTLEQTPERALRFLRAVGIQPAIRGTLMQYGFTPDDQSEGWRLLHEASGYGIEVAAPVDDGSVREAMTALDAWDEDGFRLARAVLVRRHPAQAEQVFAGLDASRGAGSVLGVQRFLERLDALEAGTSGDRAALATLAKRGIDASERARLAALVAAAQAAPEVTMPDATSIAEQSEAHLDRLRALRAWYEEWSDTARSVIKRKDYLISLGLAQRGQSGASGEADAAEAVAPDASPVA